MRLQLLAGLLDTDGSWSGKRYTITCAVKKLGYQIKQLADQLGFRTSINEIKHGYYKDGGAWVVNIGGDTWRIPCKIARKKSYPRDLKRSRLTSVLTVEPYGMGQYIGFELDGDNLFLLGDGTVTHNCQLPPVKAKFAFEVEEWQKYAQNITKLTEVRRQADKPFVTALGHARKGNGKEAMEFLSLLQDFSSRLIMTLTALRCWQRMTKWISLTFCAWASCRLKRFSLNLLDGEKSAQSGRISLRLWRLKSNALVMVLSNKSGEQKGQLVYANGDLGTVVEVDSSGAPWVKLQRNSQVVKVEYVTRNNKIPLEPGRRKELRAEGKEELIADKYEIIGGVTYMPLRVAYASTCHKAQGLTLDNVQIDFRNSFYGQPSMLYVALSRARTANGLRLVGNEQTLLAG
jgi:ATP-dependent exoDNAse (exonuclease V), alpha subunit - helicase superfamily I member